MWSGKAVAQPNAVRIYIPTHPYSLPFVGALQGYSLRFPAVL